MRHAARKDLADDRPHPLLADPHPRRDLGDRNAAVEKVDDQPFALEFLEAPGARPERRVAGGGRRDGLETIGQARFSIRKDMRTNKEHFRSFVKKLSCFLSVDRDAMIGGSNARESRFRPLQAFDSDRLRSVNACNLP